MSHLPSSFSALTEDDGPTAGTLEFHTHLHKAMSVSNIEYAEGISANPMHPVMARNQRPWGSILSFAPSGVPLEVGGGTAFLVSSRVLITAAHCLFTDNGWIDEVLIRISENEQISASSFRTTVGWAGHRDLDYDVGAIILDQPLVNRGHFGLCTLETATVANAIMHCAGFPLFKHPQSKEQSRTFVHAAGSATPLDRAMKYNFYGGVGSSGSPLWVRTAEGHRFVIAVHNRNEPGTDIRYGVRLTEELFQCIKLWIDETESSDTVARPRPVLRAADSLGALSSGSSG